MPASPDFRRLAQAALVTGARYGELAALRVADFNPDSGTVHVRTSKSGKGRHIVLNDEGAALFKSLAAGKPGDALLLVKADGSPWDKSHQARPMAEACNRAKITPTVSFHILRHTWASLAVMAGAPLMVVARNFGHADTRMVERHYGHLAPSYIADAIRAAAPKFDIEARPQGGFDRGQGVGSIAADRDCNPTRPAPHRPSAVSIVRMAPRGGARLEYNQLAAERQWLRGELPGSFLHPPHAWTKITERVEHALSRPELASFLSLLEKRNRSFLEHNRDQAPATRDRSSVPFLLGPHLFNVIHSIEARQEYLAQMPAIAGPPAEVRAHLREASAKSKALAHLLRQGPQPTVMLTEPTILFPLFPSLQKSV